MATLAELIDAKFTNGAAKIASHPQSVRGLREIAMSTALNPMRVEAVIKTDPSMTLALFQAANAPFYSSLGPVSRVRDALLRLDIPETKELLKSMASNVIPKTTGPRLATYGRRLWHHSVATAHGAAWLATRLGYGSMAEEAYLSGLLHDVGSFLLIQLLAEQSMSSSRTLTPTVVEELLEKMHCEVGEKILRDCNMPEPYLTVVSTHHHPPTPGILELVNIVRLADIVVTQFGLGVEDPGTATPATSPQAASLHAKDIVIAELEVVIENMALHNLLAPVMPKLKPEPLVVTSTSTPKLKVAG